MIIDTEVGYYATSTMLLSPVEAALSHTGLNSGQVPLQVSVTCLTSSFLASEHLEIRLQF